MRTKIGGYLHLSKTQHITQQFVDAMYAYEALGGKLRKTVMKAIAVYFGDGTNLKRALEVYCD